MDKYVIEIAQGSNIIDLNVDENQYEQTKDLFKTMDYDETISKYGDSITHILIIQENNFATIWKRVLVDITTLDTIFKNK